MRAPDIDQPGDLLRLYQRHAKKQFGQHFLTDPRILDGLIDEAGLEEGDRVLEIGPGCGTLTWRMMEHGARVLAVELDRDAAAFLEDVLVPRDGLEVIQGDALEQSVDEMLERGEEGPWRCISNLPYNVGTEVFFHLAPRLDRFERLVLMYQREVAKRFVAEPGGDDYGALSITSGLYADVRIVQTLPPGAFTPPPRVHSAAVRFDPIEGTRIPEPDVRERFIQVVRSAFQARRKILPNALAGLGREKSELEAAIEETGLERTIRPGKVSFEQFHELTKQLMATA